MGDLAQLRALAERLEKATGPDRELDRVLHYELSDVDGLELVFGVPDYTSSIDAAMALVDRLLPRWGMSLWRAKSWGEGWCPTIQESAGRSQFRAEGSPTAALAILRALVAALIDKEEDHA